MIMKRNKFTNNGGKYGGDKSTIKIIKILGLQQVLWKEWINTNGGKYGGDKSTTKMIKAKDCNTIMTSLVTQAWDIAAVFQW